MAMQYPKDMPPYGPPIAMVPADRWFTVHLEGSELVAYRCAAWVLQAEWDREDHKEDQLYKGDPFMQLWVVDGDGYAEPYRALDDETYVAIVHEDDLPREIRKSCRHTVPDLKEIGLARRRKIEQRKSEETESAWAREQLCKVAEAREQLRKAEP